MSFEQEPPILLPTYTGERFDQMLLRFWKYGGTSDTAVRFYDDVSGAGSFGPRVPVSCSTAARAAMPDHGPIGGIDPVPARGGRKVAAARG